MKLSRIQIFLAGLLISIGLFFGLHTTIAADVDITGTVDALCGNGAQEGAEACDGSDFGSETCITQGFAQGSLTCEALCTISTTNCSHGGVGPPQDNTPPVISNITTSTEQTTADIGWEATDNSGVVQVCTFSYGETPALGSDAVVNRLLHEFSTQIKLLDPATPYNFEITCRDGSGNTATETGLFTTEGVAPPQCGNGILNVGETCDDGNLVDNDGCSAICQDEGGPPGGGAVCGNNVVEAGETCDDGNLVDNDGCSAVCQDEGGPPGGGAVCGNGLLESGEECDDKNIINEDGCSAICQIEGTLPPGGGEGISLGDLSFWLAQRTIPTTLEDDTVTSLGGDIMTIGIAEQDLSFRVVEHMHVTINMVEYPFFFNPTDNNYYADTFIPLDTRIHPAVMTIDYEGGVHDVLRFSVESLPFGKTLDRSTGAILPNVDIEIYDITDILWDAHNYGQNNPIQVRVDGTYGFVVPNGIYKIQATQEGYNIRNTAFFRIDNHVINKDIALLLLLEQDAPLTGIIEQGIDKGEEILEDVGLITERFADNPQIEGFTENIIAPATALAVAAALLPSLWGLLANLLRYLFLQPFLLFGRKKRKAWGVVYNSLDKLPVDLATLRLLEAKTKRLIQSRVTDLAGRFTFIVSAGTYTLEVRKPGFTFPTQLVKVDTDGDFLDVYHGEEITITEEEASITPNIPLDPIGRLETPARLMWTKRIRILQHALSIFGITASIVSFFITPSWITGLFIVIHITLYILFIIFLHPRKPKSWGIIYDKNTKKPIKKAVLRLFNHEYNRLVSTKMTDRRGRYAFLLGNTTYYFTIEKKGYKTFTSKPIKIEDINRKGILAENVEMEQ
ncbi:MAG: DUF4215 domain-containing protein [Candidatus Magasanikbacteria bacterium]|nr:DUF4215 domain-containing protein [Candidatus Magasanikbacteria bacterium]